jgi:hypothetical protein
MSDMDVSPTGVEKVITVRKDPVGLSSEAVVRRNWWPLVTGFAQRKSEVNLTQIPDRTADEVRTLVQSEIRKIADAGTAQAIRTFLITPRLEMRTWGWAKPSAVWIVAASSRYDYGIAFSDYGFAPEHSWGLLFLSHRDFDADYCWYSTLEDAYRDSRLLEEHHERQAGQGF